jgi:uncharacterized protein YdaU (DUF1376 family)
MPLWVSDFVGDTLDLDAQEIGAYMLILMAQWQRGGKSLPDDDAKLRRVARCGRSWPRVWANIERYFDRDEDGVYSRRLRFEAANVALKREVNAHNGARGGRAKALKSNDTTLANASVSLQRNPSIPEPEPYKDLEANASSADRAIDFTKEVFDRGVAFLGKYGTPDAKARSLIGKWRRDAGDSETFNALRDANREGVTEPVSWITARLAPKQKAERYQINLDDFNEDGSIRR